MMNRSKFDFTVGIFVAFGILALAFMAMKVGNLAGFDSGAGYVIEARFENIGGLRARAPVKSAGVVVGRVESVNLDGETYEAVVRLRIFSIYRFSKDTIASVLTSGLLGEQYVGLEAGGDPALLGDGDRLAKTQSAFILEKLISQFLFSKAAEVPTKVK
jgi:phospholipid/cholesterol/gamma-HCH transport system substrate-binding protein